ncbi:odorant receptor 67a-like [Coccinella septempunctata]|uniref:odorant receptor 67a-like n=1 Tax=Coccinella septempunctata TaxID=41139 RepID=UPI001D082EBB|nr:odorant receptor 67a-like [Coccinella septempunctata]
MITVYPAIDSYILAELFEYKCRRLIKLMQETSLSRVQDVKIVKQKFHDIVRNHQAIYQCFVLIRDILGGITAPGVTVFIPLAATVCVGFVRDFNIGYLLEFLIVIPMCYLLFQSNQRITDLGEIIQDAAYDMDWYEMDKEMNKEYIIFLMKLQRPLEIKTILFVMHKSLFLLMLRNVYSFFTVLIQMN